MRRAPDFDHCICCFFEKRLPTTVLTVDSTNAVDTRIAAMAFGVVREHLGIVGNAGLEFADTFAERLDVWVPRLDAFEVHGKVVDAEKGRKDVAVLQEPLDAYQRPVDLFRCLMTVMAAGGTVLLGLFRFV